MRFDSRKFWSRFFLVVGVALIALSCTACGGATLLFSTGDAILGAVGVGLAAMGAALSPQESAAIQGAIAKVQTLWGALKGAVSAWTSGATAGTVAAVQAAITSLQGALPELIAAANIQNPALKTWITGVVAAIGAVVSYVVQNILPKAVAAEEAVKAGNTVPAETLNEQLKSQALDLRVAHEKTVESSGLPAEVQKAILDHVNHKLAHHLGPIRV